MVAPLLYARLVASFPAGVSPAAVDAVIVLARALGAELQALLLEDIATLAMAELPSPRTFDPRVALWRDVQPTEVHRELELAAAVLRRRLEAAQRAGLHAQLTVTRGGPGSVLGQYAQESDLLVVTEPADPMARWVQPFTALQQAVLASPAAVLYLPHRGARGSGPIAYFGAGVAGKLARRMAQALGAPCVDAEAGQHEARTRSLHALLAQLGERRVRVVVCDRAALGAHPQRTLQEAGDRRLAVLLTPAREGA
jgi:hypothetical protein